MTFLHLLTRFCFDDIFIDFKTLYQKNAPNSFQKVDWITTQKRNDLRKSCEIILIINFVKKNPTKRNDTLDLHPRITDKIEKINL